RARFPVRPPLSKTFEPDEDFRAIIDWSSFVPGPAGVSPSRKRRKCRELGQQLVAWCPRFSQPLFLWRGHSRPRGLDGVPPGSMETIELERRQRQNPRVIMTYTQNLERQGVTLTWVSGM